jgi:hypothetical protein
VCSSRSKVVPCGAPGIAAKIQGKFLVNKSGITYKGCKVALEGAVVDLHIRTTGGINSSTLEVAYPPPGIGAKKVQESSADHHSPTYNLKRSLALESAGVDLDIGTAGKNSSTLKVACPTPEIGAKLSRKFLRTAME